MTVPAPSFAHICRLTDDTGLFEHAEYAEVRRQYGYCTDDVARGLVVTCREPDPSADVIRLAECYLTFLINAQDATGAFHNRLSIERRWTDEPSLGDWWGRALWGLGTAAVRSPTPWIRQEALAAFRLGATRRSPHPRAMAFAGLGAAELIRDDPGDAIAGTLLDDAAAAIGVPAEDPDWPWPQPNLTYANAALAEVVISAGHLRADTRVLSRGMRMLTWLQKSQTKKGRLSVVASTGWQRHTPRARHDQQPIEVAALADAYATAAEVTGEARWDSAVRQAGAWFLGDNDAGTAMWDPTTGGGYDGLTANGPNLNQGAESTLALVATLQHLRRLSLTRPGALPEAVAPAATQDPTLSV